MDIPISEMVCRLRLEEGRARNKDHTTDVAYRWLKRGAGRIHKSTNRPSLRLQVEREPALRKTFLYASVDTFPDIAPDWLEHAVSASNRTITIPTT